MSGDSYADNYVSFSSLDTFRRCPQMWNYRYNERLESDKEEDKFSLKLGSWWHALRAVDSIRRGIEAKSLRFVPETISVDDDWSYSPRTTAAPLRAKDVILAMKEWFIRLAPDLKAEWIEAIGENPVKRIASMDRIYQRRWALQLAAEHPIAVEYGWRRELPGTHKPVVIGGYVDEIVLDTRRGVVIIRDHKTANRIEADPSGDLLNSQLPFYAWGVAEKLGEWGYRAQVLQFDRIRTKKPTEPKLTATGTLSKSVSDYDADTYFRWAKDGVHWGAEGEYIKTGRNAGKPKFGIYELDQQVLADLTTPTAQATWADRSEMVVNPNVLNAHVLAAAFTADQTIATNMFIETHGEGTAAPRNYGRTCNFCEFKQLCTFDLMAGAGSELSADELAEMGLRKKSRKGRK